MFRLYWVIIRPSKEQIFRRPDDDSIESKHVAIRICRWVKNYPHYRYVLQLAILLVGHDKIHMVYSSPTIVVKVWPWQSISVTSFFAINMDTPNFICTKEEQWAVIHFCGLKVYQVSKCIEWCQCSMGTVSCHNGLSVNGARGSKMVAQELSVGKEPDATSHPLLKQTLPTLLNTLRN